MEHGKLVGFRLNEWSGVQSRAKALWLKTVLGERPTFTQVRETRHNPHAISALEWVAFAVLIVLTIFTSYKVGALAVPFATHTLETLTAHTEISEAVQTSFILVTAALFMLLATPSVIYFKLLSGENEIEREKRDTKNMPVLTRWTLRYLTPRLPALVVYLSVAWLFVLSNQLPGTPFEKFLPVVVEIALAALVGNILDKRKAFNKVVYDALKEQTEPYDYKLANYERQGSYLRILYQVMREELTTLTRPGTDRRPTRINGWLEAEDETTVFRLISAEYSRLTSGDQFAETIVGRAEATETVVTPQPTKQAENRSDARRYPPNSEPLWTVDSLVHDLKVRGIEPSSGYSEAMLLKDYAPGHDARKVWRAGGRKAFTGQ